MYIPIKLRSIKYFKILRHVRDYPDIYLNYKKFKVSYQRFHQLIEILKNKHLIFGSNRLFVITEQGKTLLTQYEQMKRYFNITNS